jgi:hypothetical protein
MIFQAAKVLAAAAAWNAAGVPAAGRVLARALGSGDETVRTVAGMALVKAGPRSGPLLAATLDRAPEAHVPMLLRVLGDLGDPRYRDLLERHATSADPEVAQAARDALRAGC